MANTSIEIVLRILFLSFSDVNIWFVEREIIWRRYITAKVLFITQKLKLINKKKFAALALDTNSLTFVVYVVALNIKSSNITIYLFLVAQIELLKVNKAPTTILAKYSDYI